MAANAIKKQSILFPNDNEAVAVFPSATSKAEDIVRRSVSNLTKQ